MKNSLPDSTLSPGELIRQRIKIRRDKLRFHSSSALAKFQQIHRISLPPKIRQFIEDVISLRVRRAVVKACRSGGKTYGAAIIEDILWDYLDFDCINMGGSEYQAAKCYSYLRVFIHDDPKFKLFKDVRSETRKYWGVAPSGQPREDGPFISVLAASEKKARGGHPQKGRGGLLVLDEEMEMDPDVVNAAKPQLANAKPSVLLRLSTFHKSFGTFQQVWDNAESMGYTKYEWDCFDVCEACTDNCKYCFPEFREKYCRSRAKQGQGWLEIAEIKQFWIERSDDEDFEIEYMGMKPSGRGLVLEPDDVSKAIHKTEWDPGTGNTVGGHDHGKATEACSVVVQRKDDIARVVDVKFYNNVGIDIRARDLKNDKEKFQMIIVNADSSGLGEDLNTVIRRYGVPVRDINFGALKAIGIANLKWHLTRGKLWIDPKFTKAIMQLKNWKPGVKKEDHFCDALLCAMLHWDMVSRPGGTAKGGKARVGKRKRATSKQEW